MNSTYDNAITAILSGQLNAAELAGISAAIKEYRALQGRRVYYALQPGAKVRFVTSARPVYLAGATGTVRELRKTKVVVDLDTPVGRFSRGIVTPTTLIEAVA
jgi:hypothetical protein